MQAPRIASANRFHNILHKFFHLLRRPAHVLPAIQYRMHVNASKGVIFADAVQQVIGLPMLLDLLGRQLRMPTYALVKFLPVPPPPSRPP